MTSSDGNKTEAHNRTITKYLVTHLRNMFHNLDLAGLKLNTLQGFLCELQWREKFATTPTNAFWNLFEHIAHNSGENVTFEKYLDRPIKGSYDNKYEDVIFEGTLDSQGQKRKFEMDLPQEPISKKLKALLDRVIENSPSAQLDEKYYARKRPVLQSLRLERQGVFSFKCPICEKLVTGNVTAMEHMKNHMDSKRVWKPDLVDLTTCKHCFRDFDTPHMAQIHVEQVHFAENPIACRICNVPFPNLQKLEKHLASLHAPYEMPYFCQACSFRSSFFKDIHEHFKLVHVNTSKLLCHYCLKIFETKVSSTTGVGQLNNYYYHIYKHQSRSTKKCSNCCLAFINLPELKNHKKNDHVGWRTKLGIYPVKSQALSPSKQPPETAKLEMGNSPQKCTFPGYIDDYLRYVPAPKKSSAQDDFSEESNCHLCSECKKPFTSLQHFRDTVLSCDECPFTTHCKVALQRHKFLYHTSYRLYNNTDKSFLQDSMFCICGFYSSRGDRLARHLVRCKKTTCYPMTSLHKPTRRYLWTPKEKDDTSWINTSWMAPLRLTPMASNNGSKIDIASEEGKKLIFLKNVGLNCKSSEADGSIPSDEALNSAMEVNSVQFDHTYTSPEAEAAQTLSLGENIKESKHQEENLEEDVYILSDESGDNIEESQILTEEIDFIDSEHVESNVESAQDPPFTSITPVNHSSVILTETSHQSLEDETKYITDLCQKDKYTNKENLISSIKETNNFDHSVIDENDDKATEILCESSQAISSFTSETSSNNMPPEEGSKNIDPSHEAKVPSPAININAHEEYNESDIQIFHDKDPQNQKKDSSDDNIISSSNPMGKLEEIISDSPISSDKNELPPSPFSEQDGKKSTSPEDLPPPEEKNKMEYKMTLQESSPNTAIGSFCESSQSKIKLLESHDPTFSSALSNEEENHILIPEKNADFKNEANPFGKVSSIRENSTKNEMHDPGANTLLHQHFSNSLTYNLMPMSRVDDDKKNIFDETEKSKYEMMLPSSDGSHTSLKSSDTETDKIVDGVELETRPSASHSSHEELRGDNSSETSNCQMALNIDLEKEIVKMQNNECENSFNFSSFDCTMNDTGLNNSRQIDSNCAFVSDSVSISSLKDVSLFSPHFTEQNIFSKSGEFTQENNQPSISQSNLGCDEYNEVYRNDKQSEVQNLKKQESFSLASSSQFEDDPIEIDNAFHGNLPKSYKPSPEQVSKCEKEEIRDDPLLSNQTQCDNSKMLNQSTEDLTIPSAYNKDIFESLHDDNAINETIINDANLENKENIDLKYPKFAKGSLIDQDDNKSISGDFILKILQRSEINQNSRNNLVHKKEPTNIIASSGEKISQLQPGDSLVIDDKNFDTNNSMSSLEKQPSYLSENETIASLKFQDNNAGDTKGTSIGCISESLISSDNCSTSTLKANDPTASMNELEPMHSVSQTPFAFYSQPCDAKDPNQIDKMKQKENIGSLLSFENCCTPQKSYCLIETPENKAITAQQSSQLLCSDSQVNRESKEDTLKENVFPHSKPELFPQLDNLGKIDKINDGHENYVNAITSHKKENIDKQPHKCLPPEYTNHENLTPINVGFQNVFMGLSCGNKYDPANNLGEEKPKNMAAKLNSSKDFILDTKANKISEELNASLMGSSTVSSLNECNLDKVHYQEVTKRKEIDDIVKLSSYCESDVKDLKLIENSGLTEMPLIDSQEKASNLKEINSNSSNPSNFLANQESLGKNVLSEHENKSESTLSLTPYEIFGATESSTFTLSANSAFSSNIEKIYHANTEEHNYCTFSNLSLKKKSPNSPSYSSMTSPCLSQTHMKRKYENSSILEQLSESLSDEENSHFGSSTSHHIDQDSSSDSKALHLKKDQENSSISKLISEEDNLCFSQSSSPSRDPASPPVHLGLSLIENTHENSTDLEQIPGSFSNKVVSPVDHSVITFDNSSSSFSKHPYLENRPENSTILEQLSESLSDDDSNFYQPILPQENSRASLSTPFQEKKEENSKLELLKLCSDNSNAYFGKHSPNQVKYSTPSPSFSSDAPNQEKYSTPSPSYSSDIYLERKCGNTAIQEQLPYSEENSHSSAISIPTLSGKEPENQSFLDRLSASISNNEDLYFNQPSYPLSSPSPPNSSPSPVKNSNENSSILGQLSESFTCGEISNFTCSSSKHLKLNTRSVSSFKTSFSNLNLSNFDKSHSQETFHQESDTLLTVETSSHHSSFGLAGQSPSKTTSIALKSPSEDGEIQKNDSYLEDNSFASNIGGANTAPDFECSTLDETSQVSSLCDSPQDKNTFCNLNLGKRANAFENESCTDPSKISIPDNVSTIGDKSNSALDSSRLEYSTNIVDKNDLKVLSSSNSETPKATTILKIQALNKNSNSDIFSTNSCQPEPKNNCDEDKTLQEEKSPTFSSEFSNFKTSSPDFLKPHTLEKVDIDQQQSGDASNISSNANFLSPPSLEKKPDDLEEFSEEPSFSYFNSLIPKNAQNLFENTKESPCGDDMQDLENNHQGKTKTACSFEIASSMPCFSIPSCHSSLDKNFNPKNLMKENSFLEMFSESANDNCDSQNNTNKNTLKNSQNLENVPSPSKNLNETSQVKKDNFSDVNIQNEDENMDDVVSSPPNLEKETDYCGAGISTLHQNLDCLANPGTLNFDNRQLSSFKSNPMYATKISENSFSTISSPPSLERQVEISKPMDYEHNSSQDSSATEDAPLEDVHKNSLCLSFKSTNFEKDKSIGSSPSFETSPFFLASRKPNFMAREADVFLEDNPNTLDTLSEYSPNPPILKPEISDSSSDDGSNLSQTSSHHNIEGTEKVFPRKMSPLTLDTAKRKLVFDSQSNSSFSKENNGAELEKMPTEKDISYDSDTSPYDYLEELNKAKSNLSLPLTEAFRATSFHDVRILPLSITSPSKSPLDAENLPHFVEHPVYKSSPPIIKNMPPGAQQLAAGECLGMCNTDKRCNSCSHNSPSELSSIRDSHCLLSSPETARTDSSDTIIEPYLSPPHLEAEIDDIPFDNCENPHKAAPLLTHCILNHFDSD